MTLSAYFGKQLKMINLSWYTTIRDGYIRCRGMRFGKCHTMITKVKGIFVLVGFEFHPVRACLSVLRIHFIHGGWGRGMLTSWPEADTCC